MSNKPTLTHDEWGDRLQEWLSKHPDTIKLRGELSHLETQQKNLFDPNPTTFVNETFRLGDEVEAKKKELELKEKELSSKFADGVGRYAQGHGPSHRG
jgi:hypothetical protein